jgi:hypothetical protein
MWVSAGRGPEVHTAGRSCTGESAQRFLARVHSTAGLSAERLIPQRTHEVTSAGCQGLVLGVYEERDGRQSS